MADNDALPLACINPRGLVGRIYKEDHYKLLHTKHESSGPCGFREEDFFMVSHCKAMEANDPRGGAIFNPRGIIVRIYVKLCITMLHTKYRSFGSCGFREEDFPIIGLWKILTSTRCGQFGPLGHAWLAGFTMGTTKHCYIQKI